MTSLATTISDKEAQNLRWGVVAGGLVVGALMLFLWAEVKSEFPPIPQPMNTLGGY